MNCLTKNSEKSCKEASQLRENTARQLREDTHYYRNVIIIKALLGARTTRRSKMLLMSFRTLAS